MQAWHRLHVLVQLINVLCPINYAVEISQQSQWPDSSENHEILSNANFTSASLTTREYGTALNSQESFIIEKIILPTIKTNDLDEKSTKKSSAGTTEMYEAISTLQTRRSNEKTHISSLVSSRSLNLPGIDFDNDIDTSGDSEIHSPKLHKHIRTEDPDEPAEPPECHSIDPPLKFYNSNNLWNVTNSITNNLGLDDDTTFSSKDIIQVENLTVSHTTPDSLEILWNRPNGTVQVSYYFVEWKVDGAMVGSCRVSNETYIHTIVISSLTSCKTYTVIVTPYLKSEVGTEKLMTGTETERTATGREVIGVTGLDVHKDSLGLIVSAKSTNWLKISWNMPGTDCMTYYLVGVCQADNCTQENINSTTYNKTDLLPCRSYTFNVTVYGVEGAYGSVNVTGETEFLRPGKPSPAEALPGDRNIFVHWPEPIGHTCVNYYRVTWTRDGRSITDTTKYTEITLKNLDSCASYEIIINGIFVGGESQPEQIKSNKTAPAVTDPPVKLEGPYVTGSDISINWLIRTNDTNNCNYMKLIVECNGIKILGHGYNFINKIAPYDIDEGTENVTIKTSVKGLSPFTNYICHSRTINARGQSAKSSPIITDTLESVPSAPELLTPLQNSTTNTSILILWKKPFYLPGILTSITIQMVWAYTPSYPPWCKDPSGSRNISGIAGNLTSYVYDTAVPFSRYRIKMFAYTGAGKGSVSTALEYRTKAGAPSQVSKLRHIMEESSIDPNILDVTILWGRPCLVNAERIEYFDVVVNGVRDGYENHAFAHILNFTENTCLNETCALMLDNLREEHTYRIQIATKVSEYEDLGDVVELTIPFPAGIPPPPDENYTSIISIDPFKARRTATTATVLLPIFPDTGGTIRCYAIIVSKLGYNNGTFARLKGNSTGPHTASWSESMNEHFEIPYQAVKFCIDAYPSYIVDYGRLRAVKFVLGEDTETCPKLSSHKDERSYCNGPLEPDTWYDVRMRAFTDGGYRDSVIFTVKTNAELQVAIVIGTIFGILFLGILTTMLLLVRKGSLQAVLRRFLHSDMPGSPVPAPFTRRKFIAHCQQLVDNPGKLSNEYQLLQTLSVDLQMPTNAACLQANRKKNRYTDILPYDFSRVKLEVIDNDPNTDYINASFIKGFTGDEDYIACQGPKEETTYDFWRMIDQYDVKMIVMLTQLVEKNKEKCHQYFPVIRETFTYENMAIRCTMELDYRTYTQRTLVLQKEYKKRSIIHLHFKDWPDHDVPEDFDPMINFSQIMRRHIEANRGLVVVHCSAGIGRTGTLIAIDILLQHLKDNRKLDVFGTVYRLRHHRINMVQRESQYAYIYNCIKQVLKNPYFSKTYKPPSVDPIFDNSHKKKEASDSSTNLVSSLETLKKSSFSTSVESGEPIYQTSSNSTSKSRTCYPFNDLRCAKSTGAIDTRPYKELIGRCNTHNHPISDIVNDPVEIKSSDISFDMTESEGSTTSLYENMQPLSRSKSAHAFGRDEDPCVTQKLLDTSL